MALPLGSRMPLRRSFKSRWTLTQPTAKLDLSRSVGSRTAICILSGTKEKVKLRPDMPRSLPFSSKINDDDDHSI